MGMAHKSPTSIYRGLYWVTTHAIERFRTRISSSSHSSLNTDEEIASRIDFLVKESLAKGNGKSIVDEGERCLLVDIRNEENGNDLWAVVKENNSTKSKGSHPEAVVTLLYSDMVKKSYESGKWREPEKPTVIPIVENETIINKLEMIVIRYYGKDKGPCYSEWADIEKAEEFLNKIRANVNVDPTSIRIFKEVPVEVKAHIVL